MKSLTRTINFGQQRIVQSISIVFHSTNDLLLVSYNDAEKKTVKCCIDQIPTESSLKLKSPVTVYLFLCFLFSTRQLVVYVLW